MLSAMLTMVRTSLAALLLSGGALHAAQGQDFFEKVQAKMTAMERLSQDRRPPACREFIGQVLDTADVASAVASAHWDGLGRRLRSSLVSSVVSRLAEECVDLLPRTGSASASIARVREIPGGLRMTVALREEDGRETLVVWTIRPGGAFAWTALDISVDGRGMRATLRSDFDSALMASGGNLERAIQQFSRMGSK